MTSAAAAPRKVFARREPTPPAPRVAPPRRVRDLSHVARIDLSALPAKPRPSILWPHLASVRVSSPDEPAEREASATAKTVMGMSAARVWPPGETTRSLRRHPERRLDRDATGEPAVSDDVLQDIHRNLTSGAPLSDDVRRFMEPRFEADFGAVRIHTDEDAARLSTRLAARAFAYGRHIFFGRNQYRPQEPDGAELLAHELTHTIQQRAVVQRTEAPRVEQSVPAQVQRLGFGVGAALNYIADKANIIPGFRMFTIVLGVNPINMSAVDASLGNILRAVIEFIPGAGLITQALDNSGVFDKVANWAAQQIKTLGMVGSSIKQALLDFLERLNLTDIARLGWVWDQAKAIFTGPIERIKSFVKGFVSGIVQFVKDAILPPIAHLAEGTEGYNLLKGVLGKDPITDAPVERSADTLLGPLMRMAGQSEFWAKMQEARAIPRCWAWFKSVIPQLLGFVSQIPALFVSAFKSLTLEDIILVPKAFAKLVKVFGGFVVQFVSWAGNALWNLLEIIFDVISPGALGYVKKTGAALKSILKNPLPFVGNLVKAAKAGFQNFASNFLTHLKAGLLDWLTGSLPGVYIPQALTLIEFGKMALSVFGISWAQIRGKIVRALGPNGEAIMQGLEQVFDVVKALVTGGPAAAWEVIKEKLTNLKDMIVDGIIGFIKDVVVTKAIPKLIAMFIPGAGFISAIISIYDTVMVFVEKIKKIIEVVTAFIDNIVAIAAGNIGAAAAKVESILGRLLSLAISFLAGFVGLGKVADKVMGVIHKVRDKVDQALDTAINWIVGKAKALFAKVFSAVKAGAKALLQWWKKKASFSGGGESHTVFFQGEKESAQVMVRSAPMNPEDFVKPFVPSGGPEAKEVPSLSKDIANIAKKVAAAQKKDPPDEGAIAKLDGELTVAFNALGAVLAKLLDAGEDEGSEKNPLPVDYPKRRASAYPNIYVGPSTLSEIKQAWLKDVAGLSGEAAREGLAAKESKLRKEGGFKAWSGKVSVFRAAGGPGQPLPDGRPVGLDPAFANLAPGKVLVYTEKGGTGGGDKINKLFQPFGFRARNEGLDGDHVMERQLGGPDAVANLWPLPFSENRSSGAKVKSLPVVFKKKSMTVHEAKQERKKALHLLIKSTI